MEEELARAGHLVADEQVEVPESQREQQAGEGRVEMDARRAGPGRGAGRRARSVRAAHGIVELGLARARHDVGARPFAEVDPRLTDRRYAGHRNGWQIRDEEVGLTLGRRFVDRHHRDADPMGERDALVDPLTG